MNARAAVGASRLALAQDVPNGRSLVYPDAGHFMCADAPERFARDVAAFPAGAAR